MERLKRYNQIAIFITSIMVFSIWQLLDGFDFNRISENPAMLFLEAPLKYLISYLCSYAIFAGLTNFLINHLINIPIIKKKLLSNYYVDGEWASFYIMRDELRLVLKTYTQTLTSISSISHGYKKGGLSNSTSISSSLTIHEESKQIIGTYEDESISRGWSTYGYIELNLQYEKKFCYPTRMKGFFFELGMDRPVQCVAYRVPEEVSKLPTLEKVDWCYSEFEAPICKELRVNQEKND